MSPRQINRLSSIGISVVALTAALAVAPSALISFLSRSNWPTREEQADLIGVFLLVMLALVPMIVLFFATANWREPSRIVRRLAFPAVALVFAFSVLYYI
jgi:uncharacterized membrane protein